MRYFLKVSVSAPFVEGGHTFEFEPVSLRGGSWLGVLAVEDDSAANALISANLHDVAEITKERYELEKKKALRTSNEQSEQLSKQSDLTLPPLAAPATSRTHQRADDLSSVSELKTTDLTPPREPVLEEPSMAQKGRMGRKVTQVT